MGAHYAQQNTVLRGEAESDLSLMFNLKEVKQYCSHSKFLLNICRVNSGREENDQILDAYFWTYQVIMNNELFT